MHTISNALDTKKSIKIKITIDITYEKPVPYFDAQIEWKIDTAAISIDIPRIVVHSNINKVFYKDDGRVGYEVRYARTTQQRR